MDHLTTATAPCRWRPCFHFAPPFGWMNDPNGLIFFRGQYHLFYQYNPLDVKWGPMYWGHAVSKDMLQWVHLPIALAPDQHYEQGTTGGCFSGSGVEWEGRLYLLYTAASQLEGRTVQAHCLACSTDGVHFEKYAGNPVLSAPEGYDGANFRDPKVWREDGKFFLLCGASLNGEAQALLFTSHDLLQWQFVSVFYHGGREMGSMWECMDYYAIEGTEVLTFSPVGWAKHRAIYMEGQWNKKTNVFEPYQQGMLDFGPDCYAAQSLLTEDGRRVMLAWANQWEWMDCWRGWGATAAEGWRGSMVLPREVHRAVEGGLRFPPIREAETLRGAHLPIRREDQTMEIPALFECYFTIVQENQHCRVVLGDEVGEHVTLSFDLRQRRLMADWTKADPVGRSVTDSPLPDGMFSVRLLADRSFLEVFIAEGTIVHSACVYPAAPYSKLKICCETGRVETLTIYPLHILGE